MTNNYSFLLLLTVATLLLSVHSLVCKDEAGLSNEEKTSLETLANTFKMMTDEARDNYERSVGKSREFIDFENANQVVRIAYYKLDQADMVNEYDFLKTMTEVDVALDGSPRIVERVVSAECWKNETKITFRIVIERFRGFMTKGLVKDTKLKAYLALFENRLSMYKSLAVAMQQVYAKNIKFNNLDASTIMYKKAEDDFSASPFVENDSPYIFVLSDFRFAKGLDDASDGAMTSFLDHEDYLGNVAGTDELKRTTEIFNLGMVFLQFETTILTRLQDPNIDNRPQAVSDVYSKMPETSCDLSISFGSKTPFAKNVTWQIFNTIVQYHRSWNHSEEIDEDITMSYASFGEDVAYYLSGVSMIFGLQELTVYPGLADKEEAMGKVGESYAALIGLILKMVGENKADDGRPNQDEVAGQIDQIQNLYKEGIAMLSRRRLLMV